MATAPNAAGLAAGQATIVRLPVKPSRVKLTARNVLALPGPSQGSERMFYDSDVPALALRISSSGHRTFVVTGRTGSGRSFRMKLGDARSITPAAARRAAQAIMGKIASGRTRPPSAGWHGPSGGLHGRPWRHRQRPMRASRFHPRGPS